MGPGKFVVEVLSLIGQKRYRGDRFWEPQWTKACVDEELLNILKNDQHLKLKILDAQDSAEYRMSTITSELEKVNKSLAELSETKSSLEKVLAEIKVEHSKAPKKAPKQEIEFFKEAVKAVYKK